ncbi:MAG: DNA repair protein RadA [archaeon GW2011_AR17]|nr:MAG: DNA repair protein RadA [archaeon GW2011_AR17]HIH15296.1 hypothetical protein [Nanoarchaeota archaeon]HIH58549.1 hypothetical protein [Nanoarchaeota archaeon]HII14200.1 hypothetical protein [Nanoarchaeota archaeon]HIJ05122.1 hypothetical protein [Nanoarchaeota archaeon]
MAKIKEMNIEDLPGVGAATAEKLREAGYQTLMAIAVASPGELVETAGVGEAVARKMINIARNNLDMGFMSGDELLKKRAEIIRISTGSKSFDTMLNGGFESGGITECYGQFGSGKSALAHQLAINALDINEQGEPQCFSIWIDSENTFRPERIKEICEHNNWDPMTILKNIKVVRAFNSDHQMMCAEKIEDLITKEGLKVKLVIVDSLMTHFRSEFCVTPNMDVIGNPKIKNITEYAEGEKVLTHKGRFTNILSTQKQEYEGKIVRIRPAYLPAFTLTPDHSVLAVKRIRNTWYKNQSTYTMKDSSNYSKVFPGKNHYKLFEGYGPDWIMAGTLEKGDYLAYPVLTETKDQDFFLLTDYTTSPFPVSEGKIQVKDFFHGQDVYETILKEYAQDTSKGKMMELSKKHQIPMSTISQWVNGKQKSLDPLTLDVHVPITEESLRLFGYYIAEGHVNDHQVIFTFHVKEKEYIQDVERLMKKVFGISANKEHIEENAYRIVFSHKVLAEAFGNLFGKLAPNKKMPLWVLNLPVEKQREIIKGHWSGDGTTSAWGYRFDTTSKLLAEQIKQILLRMRIIPCMRIDTSGRKKQKYVIEAFGKQLSSFSEQMRLEEHPLTQKRKQSYNHGWFEGDYAFLPIRETKETEYKGPVYNLEVEEDSSYALSSVVVHNCGRGTLADRQQKINKHMHALMKLADTKNLCVYVTNQVMSKPDTFFGDPTAAIGGNIVGHNCLTEDSLIQMHDGDIVPMFEIFDKERVCSVNFTNGMQSVPSKIGKIVVRNDIDKEYIIKTLNRITCSPGHRFFKVENFGIVECEAKDLQEGEYLAQGLALQIEGSVQTLPEIKIREMVTFDENATELIEVGMLGNRGELCAQLTITPRQLRRVLHQNSPTNAENVERLIALGVSEQLRDHTWPYYSGKHQKMQMPTQLSVELAQLFGYFIGDGNFEERNLRFKDERRDVLEVYNALFIKVFGKEGHIRKETKKNCFILDVNSTEIMQLFRKVDSEMISLVSKSPQSHVCAFLKGFFDADGSVDKDSCKVSVSQRDSYTIRLVQLLLNRVGIRANLRRQVHMGNPIFHLTIGDGESVLKYVERIGMSASDKHRRLQEIKQACKKSYTQMMSPIKRKDLWMLIESFGIYPSTLMKPRTASYEYVGMRELQKAVEELIKVEKQSKELNFLISLLGGEIRFEKIRKISVKSCPGQLFFDFSVPGNENYFANGFLTHNSQTRIYLRKGKGDTRVAKLVDSPYLADGEAIFRISEKGIIDAK